MRNPFGKNRKLAVRAQEVSEAIADASFGASHRDSGEEGTTPSLSVHRDATGWETPVASVAPMAPAASNPVPDWQGTPTDVQGTPPVAQGTPSDVQGTPTDVQGSPTDVQGALPNMGNALLDPGSTGPMSLEAINTALAMNQHYYQEAQAKETANRKRARRFGRWAGIAAALAGVAVVGLLGYLQLLVGTVSQIDDDRVVADIMADPLFSQGSASDTFVEPVEYSVESVEVTDRQTNGEDVVVKADVSMGNGFFSEKRKVTVTYVNDGDEWQGTCQVDSHSVVPLRGISGDEEFGISEEDVAYDEESQTCTANRWVEGAEGDSWFLSTQGTEVVSYAFADDTWSRSGVDDSQLWYSFQGLSGKYAAAEGQSLMWTAASGSGQMQDFQITWVDDASATFGGTFAWTSGTSRRFSTSQETGEFAGWIDQDGNVGAECDGTAGSLAFTGRANADGGLDLDYVVYYNSGVDRFFGIDSVSQASGSVTLYQNGYMAQQSAETPVVDAVRLA